MAADVVELGDCVGCGFKVIQCASQTGSDGLWHVECYVCTECQAPLRHGLFHELKENMFCRTCYARLCLGKDYNAFFESTAHSSQVRRTRVNTVLPEDLGSAVPGEAAPSPSAKADAKKKKDPDDMGTYISYAIGMAVMQSSMEAAGSLSKTLQPEHFSEITEMTPTFKNVNFNFNDHAPQVFTRLRERFNVRNNDYVVSLAGTPLSGGSVGAGKSGMLFYFSADKQYIIKTVTQSELPFFMKCINDYYNYMTSDENAHTLLPRFFGLYKIKLPKKKVCRIIVMNNVFLTPFKIHEKYDLKGSTHGREEEDDSAGVLKDLNFKQQIALGPDKKPLMEQIRRDADFLTVHNMMDYSLLLGIHKVDKKEAPIDEKSTLTPNYSSTWQKDFGGFHAKDGDIFFFGIIDILQEYNLKKKVENAYKSKRVAEPDTISAVDAAKYARRFVQYIDSITVGD